MKNKTKIQESITNISNLGLIPADEKQLNIDVVYNSILDEVCSVVPMNSPRQIISFLRLVYGSEKKAVNEKGEDVYGNNLMHGVGAMPLDESGYPTEYVKFETTTLFADGKARFMGMYKNVVPTTIKFTIGDSADEIIDNGQGKLLNSKTEVFIGTVNYETAVFEFTAEASSKVNVEYVFDIYDLMTSRNFAQFIKDNLEVFAELFQLDVDSALVLDDFKGVNLRDNIKNIVPQVLSQQIDHHILSKYFDLVDNNYAVQIKEWNAEATHEGYSITDLLKDFGTLVNLEMNQFTKRTGVVPNVILCDPVSFSVLSVSKLFVPLNKDEQDDAVSGTPKKVGYFNNAKVIFLQYNIESSGEDKQNGRLVITYKGPSEAQSASAYGQYIPVTLRNVQGMEAGGMIVTNNIYSMGGFVFTNPELVAGVKIINLNLDIQ